MTTLLEPTQNRTNPSKGAYDPHWEILLPKNSADRTDNLQRTLKNRWGKWLEIGQFTFCGSESQTAKARRKWNHAGASNGWDRKTLNKRERRRLGTRKRIVVDHTHLPRLRLVGFQQAKIGPSFNWAWPNCFWRSIA